jgi:hypothetical protein
MYRIVSQKNELPRGFELRDPAFRSEAPFVEDIFLANEENPVPLPCVNVWTFVKPSALP